jgi:CRISP-associated protein Cas1
MAARVSKNTEKSATVQFQDAANLIEEETEDDIAWATRSGMWQSRVAKASAPRTKRAKAQPALILAGHGVSLRVENGALTIQNGFTHYPQKREIIRYFLATSHYPSALFY